MNDNRRKLTGILKLLYENTDAEHSMDTYQIMDALESMGYGRPDRKTIDSNIKFIIEDLGMGVIKEKGKPNRYKWIKREFELSELKVLVDSVCTSRFISPRKSREFITKFKDFASIHQAATLNHEIYCVDSYKKDLSEALRSTDVVNEAIKSGHKVKFTLADYDMDKNEILSDNGKEYEVSPYVIISFGNTCYLLGTPSDSNDILKFSIADMRGTAVTHSDAVPAPLDFNIARYTSRCFDLTASEISDIILSCKDRTMKAMVDKFGKTFVSEQTGADRFRARVRVEICPEFYTWLFSFGGDIKIIEPEYIRREYEAMLRKQLLSGY